MNSPLANKNTPILKIVISLLVGILAVMFTRVFFDPISLFLCVLISSACYTFVVYYWGLYSFIPAAVVFLSVFIFEDISGAISVVSPFFTAIAAGYTFRHKMKPVNAIVSISFAYAIYIIVAYVALTIIAKGSFSFTEELNLLLNQIDENTTLSMEMITSGANFDLSIIESASALFKALSVGIYIASIVVQACITYFATAVYFKIIKTDSAICSGSIFDVITSRITAAIYILCMVATMFSNVSANNLNYSSMLPQNLLLILTPVLVYSGVYYIITIKFKVDHESPFMLILSLISSFFGAYYIIVLYLALSGVKYSFKYSKAKVNEEAKNDQEQ